MTHFHFGRFARSTRSPDWRGHGRSEFGGHDLGRHGPRHRGRRGRIFEQGDLRYVLLKLIADKPSHGYELIKDIEDRLGGAYSPSPGVVYPTLTLLEELGLIRAVQSEGARKAYEITDEGRATLEKNNRVVEEIFRRIGEMAERLGARPPHQIVRAMENLRLALRLRLERGKLSEQQIADVAAALDAAAQTVERE
jgi:DNA-binding PadR family transcriptional regulator